RWAPRVRRRAGARVPSLVLATVLALVLGAGWANWRATVRMAAWLPDTLAGQNLVLSGFIAGLPDVAAHGTRFLFAPDAGAEGIPERVLLSWRNPPMALAPGQRWEFTARLKRPRGLANPHGFDYAYWLMGEGIGATGYVRAARAGPLPGHRAPIAQVRAALRERMHNAMPGDAGVPARFAGVLVALAIGDQRGIAQADWDIFRRTGISHLVSISGLHITMLSGAAGGIVHWLWRHSLGLSRRLRRPLPLRWPARQAGLVAAVVTALAYGLIAGMQIPALRTVAMLVVAAVALWSGRCPPPTMVLAWAAAAAIAIDPWAVMSPGFWLSFGAVAVIFLAAARRDLAADPAAEPGAVSGADPAAREARRGRAKDATACTRRPESPRSAETAARDARGGVRGAVKCDGARGEARLAESEAGGGGARGAVSDHRLGIGVSASAGTAARDARGAVGSVRARGAVGS
ncbi:ComEC/Rec2 family competence protein, partial [Cupriavidus plantarum]